MSAAAEPIRVMVVGLGNMGRSHALAITAIPGSKSSAWSVNSRAIVPPWGSVTASNSGSHAISMTTAECAARNPLIFNGKLRSLAGLLRLAKTSKAFLLISSLLNGLALS